MRVTHLPGSVRYVDFEIKDYSTDTTTTLLLDNLKEKTNYGYGVYPEKGIVEFRLYSDQKVKPMTTEDADSNEGTVMTHSLPKIVLDFK